MNFAISVQNFSYTYHDATAALDDISVDIEHGRHTALIGPNGAGKSTLMLAMAGFIKGTGKVFIDGLEVTRANKKDIRKRIGCCLQNPDDQLFMPSLADDIAFGPLNMGLSDEQIAQRTNDALDTVGLTGLGDRMPHHLSAGQKRAAAIATVLAMEPAIITLDEPDTSLDPRQREKLIKLLSSLKQTLVIATCNMDFAARLCEQAILLDDKRLIKAGPAREIMADEKLMERHGLEVPAIFRD